MLTRISFFNIFGTFGPISTSLAWALSFNLLLTFLLSNLSLSEESIFNFLLSLTPFRF